MPQTHILTVPGRYDQVRKVCAFVKAGAVEAGFSGDAAFQIELSCDEAVTNIIEHAYEGEDKGKIKAGFSFDGTALTITLWDNGRSFNPGNISAPKIPNIHQTSTAPNFDVQIGGLGLHFMRTLMDEVRYSSVAKEGNTLIMVKLLQKETG